MAFDGASDPRFIVQSMWAADTAGDAVEGGEIVGPVGDDRHAMCLEILHGQTQIEDALRSSANDRDLRTGELNQVRGDIHGPFRSSMHSSDARRREERDVCQLRCYQ